MKKVSSKSQFESNLFLMLFIGLKNLNQCNSHHHFKMENLQTLRDILKHDNFMCKLDLNDAYFCMLLV